MHFPMGHNCAIVGDEAKKTGKIGLDYDKNLVYYQ